MAERKKLEVTVLQQEFNPADQDRARQNIGAAPMSAVSALNAKTVTKLAGNNGLTATSARAGDGSIEYTISVTAEPTDTRLTGYDGISAKNIGNGLWAVGLSGKYLSANALDSLSGNWENAYKAVSGYSGDFANWKQEYNIVSANSGKWNDVSSKLDTAVFSNISGSFALSADLNAHTVNTAIHVQEGERDKWNTVDNKLDTTTFTSWTAQTENWDKVSYSGKDGIKVENHEISISADYVKPETLDNYYTKDETSAASAISDALDTKQDNLTTGQLSAISSVSGIESTVSTHISDTDIHIQDGERNKWNKVTEKLDITAFSTVSGNFALSADVYSKDEINDKFEETSSWANDTFQPVGNYLSASNNFLSANALDNLSGNWENVYSDVNANSAAWNEVSAKLDEGYFNNWLETDFGPVTSDVNTLKSSSADWNDVSAKLNSSDFTSWTAREFVSVKTDVDTLKENSAHNTVESQNEYIEVQSGTNKFELKFVSGDLATKTWVNEELGDFGGYVPCEGTGADNHPDIANPDSKKMYLVPKQDATDPDRYYNWIVTGDETTGWLCIGDTSMDLTPYLKIEDISDISGNWNTAYNYVTANSANIIEASGAIKEVSSTFTANSANWQDSYNALTSTSADWNNHSALSATKLDASESAKFMLLSDIQSNTAGEIIGYGTSSIFHPTYSGKNGIKVEDYWISVSADYQEKGDYLSANALNNLSGNWEKSYTALTSTSGDWNNAYNWVTENSDNIANASATVKANSAAWNESSAFSANSGKFVTSGNEISDVDLAYILKKSGNTSVWSGIDLSDLGKIYPVTSLTPDLVSATISSVNDVPTYVLSAAAQDEIPGISGYNNVSAYYDPTENKYLVGLDKDNLVTYGTFRSDNTKTYTTGVLTLSTFTKVDSIGTDIYLNSQDSGIYVNAGLYHFDIQVDVTVPGNDNNYYTTILKTVHTPASEITQIIDGSYAHKETLTLSFDSKFITDDVNIQFTIESLPANATVYVNKLNIHRIICSLSDFDGSITYQPGDAISIDSNTNAINVEYEPASGIDIVNNKLVIKLGDGLKFDDSGATIGTLSLDTVTQEVVETVEEMTVDMDTKVTVSMPFNCIVGRGVPTDFETGKNRMIGQLFSVAINNDLRIGDTVIEVFGTDTPYTQSNPIFGLYEYDFDYPRYTNDDPAQGISGYGRTLWVCDTGPVQCTTGKMQFPITHLNPECAKLKASRVYYATIAIAANAGAGPQLAGCAGYGQTFNANPVFTTDAQDITTVDFTDPSGTLSGTGFWQNSYHEMPAAYRFFMQIRNKSGV